MPSNLSPARATANAADAAAAFDANPVVRAVAFWTDESGSTHVWPQATADNRPTRVFARMQRVLGATVDTVFDLTVIHRP